MALPKAELSLNETATEVTFVIPCPCGSNNLVHGRFVFGVRDYRALCNEQVCSACKRACTVTVEVQNSSLQKVVKFEYGYTTLSGPEYWTEHAQLMGGCVADFDDEKIKLPKNMPDMAIIKSTTFSCWWENRLGMVPILAIQQNLP